MSIPGYKDPDKVRVNAYVPKDQHKALKDAANHSETTIEELVVRDSNGSEGAPQPSREARERSEDQMASESIDKSLEIMGFVTVFLILTLGFARQKYRAYRSRKSVERWMHKTYAQKLIQDLDRAGFRQDFEDAWERARR